MLLKEVVFQLLILHCILIVGTSLIVNGIKIPHAKSSYYSKFLETWTFPENFPYRAADLTPDDLSNDQLFYLIPKFVHHAADESREALTEYYTCILPQNHGTILDLCSSFTSHYPQNLKTSRCALIGLNPLELAANPSKTEWIVQNLNSNPTLPFSSNEFDVITNSLSVDYITQPLELFQEMHRVLKPGGLAAMAFTNRCFPTKIVPIWARPFTDLNHIKIVCNYFHFSATWIDLTVVDVSPSLRNPMFIVQARKPL